LSAVMSYVTLAVVVPSGPPSGNQYPCQKHEYLERCTSGRVRPYDRARALGGPPRC
jgi:hypothetical protein